jgi:hypothetical protein
MEFKDQWNVKHNIQSRLKALFTSLPEPLEVAIEEQAVNEFFACLILDKTGESITVRKVYDLVGGDNNKVAARLKTLRPYLKERQGSDDSAIAALKKQIEKQVRGRLELDLIEQENDYLDQLSTLKEHSDLIVGRLTEENAILNGRVIAMQSQIEDQKNQLGVQLKLEASLHQSIKGMASEHEKFKSSEISVNQKNKDLLLELESQKQANKTLVNAYSERLNTQQSVIEHGQTIQNQLMKEIAELNHSRKSLNKRLSDTKKSLLAEQRISTEQARVIGGFGEHTDLSLLIKESLAQALAPTDSLTELTTQLQEMLKLDAIDTSTVNRSINSLETQVLNGSKAIETLIISRLPKPPSDQSQEKGAGD